MSITFPQLFPQKFDATTMRQDDRIGLEPA